MEKQFLQLKVEGIGKNGLVLSKQNYDIADLKNIIESMDLILSEESGSTLVIIENGCILNKFFASLVVISNLTVGINQIKVKKNIDFLAKPVSQGIQKLQDFARQRKYTISLKTSQKGSKILKITPDTNYYPSTPNWVDIDLYLYGRITDAGGKEKANIHLDTDKGLIKIKTTIKDLKNIQGNPLYKNFRILVSAKQNIFNGEIDPNSYSLKDIFEMREYYDEEELDRLIENSRKWTEGRTTEEILKEMRGV
jgi:hypothetical protein